METHLITLALRNIIRQRTRSAATLLAIAIGVAGLILAGGFVQDIYIQLGEAMIHSQTGHIQVTKQGYSEGKTRSPEKYLIENPDQLKASVLKSNPDIQQTMARLGFSGVVNNGKRDLGIIGEGIAPDAEADVGTNLQYLEGRALKNSDLEGIVVGQGVAKSLGLKIGDRITLVITRSGCLARSSREQGPVFQLCGQFAELARFSGLCPDRHGFRCVAAGSAGWPVGLDDTGRQQPVFHSPDAADRSHFHALALCQLLRDLPGCVCER